MKIYEITEEQLRTLEVLAWGARFVAPGEPEKFNWLIDQIRKQEVGKGTETKNL
jgi:hypothetical protein